jgi:hypothetical protein
VKAGQPDSIISMTKTTGFENFRLCDIQIRLDFDCPEKTISSQKDKKTDETVTNHYHSTRFLFVFFRVFRQKNTTGNSEHPAANPCKNNGTGKKNYDTHTEKDTSH